LHIAQTERKVKFEKCLQVGKLRQILALLTTMGYGNIAPVTFPGRLFCIFFAIP
jgi:hypothetical protein